MGFNVEFQDKEGKTIEWERLDREVCELWGVELDADKWATPPGKEYRHNWHEFGGWAVMLNRGDKATGAFNPTDLLIGPSRYGTLYPILEKVDEYKYEIQLILDWSRKGYVINVSNRW